MKNPRGLAAAVATVAVSAILFVPYCGVLFDCGCDWPWAGWSSRCNIHNPKSPAHCPWCASPLAGGVSFLVAAAAGVVVSLRGDERSRAGGGGGPGGRGGARTSAGRRRPAQAVTPRTARADFAVRALAGVGAFLVVALIAAWITALATGYPKFLG